MEKLSKRENEILSYLPFYSVKEIADKLCISYETAKKTIANIKLKTGYQKATELTAYLFSLKFNIDFEELKKRVLSIIFLGLTVIGIHYLDDDILRGRNTKPSRRIESTIRRKG